MYIVKSFKEINKELSKEVCAGIRDSNQMSFGMYLENNLITAMQENEDSNNVVVAKTSQAHDYIFGADFKMSFINPFDDRVDGMSMYADITLNLNKPNVQWLGLNGNIFFLKKRIDGADTLLTLENGLKVHLGIKSRSGNKFFYKKPVLVIGLSGDGFITNCMFSENDICMLVNLIRRAGFYVAYHMHTKWLGEVTKGAGKRASDMISVNEAFAEIAFEKEEE